MDSGKKDLVTYLDRNLSGEYLLDEPLSLHTWYRIGGPSDFFVYPRNVDDLINLLQHCRSLNVGVYFIGEGANILVSDAGYRGVMINLARYFKAIQKDGEIVHADAGTLLQDLILYYEKNSLGGLEYLSGIPGTVGGALIMNAGTRNGEIGRTVLEVYTLNQNLEWTTVSCDKINFGYRSAPELQDKIILGCKIRLFPKKESTLRQVRLSQMKKRAAKQPLEYPSCGSVFKRPSNHHYVGKMVEEAGLKGLRHGNAMISKKHGGFMVNLGNAKASDVMHLIEKVKEEIYTRYAIQLEPEVRFVGF